MVSSTPVVSPSRGFDPGQVSHSLTLAQSLKLLLLAPAGAVSVAVVLLLFFDDDNDFDFSMSTAVLLVYFLAVCYLAELLFVVPGFVLRPAFRTPHPISAVAYGILVAWSLPVAGWLIDGPRWEALTAATVAGAASGGLCAALTRKLVAAQESRAQSD
jgi:hypothetical protein